MLVTERQERIAAEYEVPAPGARPALVTLSLAMLMASLGTSVATVALPTIANSFETSFEAVQWVVLAYLLVTTALSVVAGRLGDLIGRRRLMVAGIALFTLASAASAAAPNLAMVIGARAMQGLGAAFMMALALSFAGEAAPGGRTGSAMGLLGTMSAVGTALGPSLGGALVGAFGWRAIFLVNLPLGIAAFLLARRALPPDPAAAVSSASLDIRRTLLLALTLVAYALAMTTAGSNPGMVTTSLILTAGFAGSLFARAESRSASPLIDPTLVRLPALQSALAMSALVTTVVMATLVVGPFFLTHALGLDPASVGLVLTAGPVAAALTGIPAGAIVDRYGARRTATIGLMMIGAGSVLMAAMSDRPDVAEYIARIVLITAGHGLFQAANNTAVMTSVQSGSSGAVAGMLNLARNLGLIIGASVMGTIFTLASTAVAVRAGHPEAAMTGMRATFAVATLLVLLSLAIRFLNTSKQSRSLRP